MSAAEGAPTPLAEAGEGNPTLVVAGSYSFTIKLHPRAPIKLTRLAIPAKSFSVPPGRLRFVWANPN